MANLISKTADLSPSGDDLVYVVNNPAGTPGDRKVTIDNLAAAQPWATRYASAQDLANVPELVATQPTEVVLTPSGGNLMIALSTEIVRQATLSWVIQGITQYSSPIVDRLTTDYTHPQSNTTLASAGLDAAVVANTIYEVEVYCYFVSTGAADIKFAWNYPAGATMRWNCSGPPPGIAFTNASAAVAINDLFPVEAIATNQFTRISGVLNVGATAGSLGLLVAQLTADPSDTKILSSSTLVLRKLA